MQMQAQRAKLAGVFEFEHVRDGRVIDRWTAHNHVVDVGITDWLQQYFNGSTYTAVHHMGLLDSSPTTAITDTMGTGNHAGWNEETIYSESNRPTISWDTAAAKSIDNSTSKASFSVNATGTIGGAFIVVNENTKGGESGTLFSAAAFDAGNRSVLSGDTLNVQYTLTGADA